MIRSRDNWACSSWKREGSRADLISTFQYIKRSYKKDEGLLTRACSDRAKGIGFKLKDGRFRLHIRKKFFMMRVMRHCTEV